MPAGRRARRATQPAKAGYHDRAIVDAFDHVVRFETPRLGFWLDTSDLMVTATVDTILASLARAAV